jgi:hypothetical protein
MPPKKNVKAIEEDFSDVPTLPELNALIFTMILDFKNKDRKQEVFNKIKDTWKDKVKVITREDIIDYGRRKLTIAEDEDVNNIQKVAKAASEKLFEQFVQARREKKEKLDKLKEEAKAQATEENPDPKPNVDPNAIDCFFHMPDYPKNDEEALALNSYQYALNTLVYIEEKPATFERKVNPEADEDGNIIEGEEQVIIEEEKVPEASRVPPEESQKLKELLESLQSAVKNSQKESALRTFVVLKKEYIHKVPESIAEGQEPISEEAKQKASIQQEVFEDLNKMASNLIKFKKFKLNASLIKLKSVKHLPEEESRLEKTIDREEEKHEEVKAPVEPIKETGKVDKSKQALDKSKPADKTEIHENKIEEEMPKLPDQTLPIDWNDETYHAIVKELPEEKKSIAGLLSACVLNVCSELEKEQKMLDQDNQELEEADDYKYIFDDILAEANSSQGFVERNIMSAESAFSKSAHRSMFSSAQRSRENWNQDAVLDEQDVSSYANDYILSNGDNIAAFERAVLEVLKSPGVERYEMPNVPEKSQLRRDAEMPEMYPFATIPVEELERALMLKAIEEQFRQKEPDFSWDFLDRSIEEQYTRKSLVQELSDLLLWEPDCMMKYFSRDDSLLLGIYQKLPLDRSYTKQWKSSYRSMPDFANWLEHFSKDSDAKFPLYDIDDNKVGNIREFCQNLTPSNGGLMRIKKYNIGRDEISSVLCFKDSIIFGIHQAKSDQDLSDDFWIQYDRNTRLDVRKIIGIERYITQPKDDKINESMKKEGQAANPPVETEEEKERNKKLAEENKIAEEARINTLHQEHAAYRLQGAGATLVTNNGNLIGMLPNGYIMQSQSNIQKELILNPDKVYVEDCEESRIITSKSIIRYLANRKIEILYANGNFSQYDPATDLWTITNNEGKRRCKRQSNGETFDIDPIPAAIETCAETSAQVLFKEDNVISILYPNGVRYTVHHEGTKIITNHDETEIVVEKVGYSQVKILSGRMLEQPEKVKEGERSDSEIEFYESLQTSRQFLKDRIKDGQIIQTYLHDKSVIQSFIEANEFGKEKENDDNLEEDQPDEAEEGIYYQAVHLIRRQDMSVTKVTQDGEICLISGPTRNHLNKSGELMKTGRDYDYLDQLFNARSEERKGGIFTCSLNKSNITTHDKDRNLFTVNSNGTFQKVLAPEISEVDQINEAQDQEDIHEFSDMEAENIAIKSQKSKEHTRVPKVDIERSKIREEDQSYGNILPNPPRIFCIKNNGVGSEFFTKERMHEETRRFSNDVIMVKSTELLGQNPVSMHSYFKPLKSNEEIDEEFSVVAQIQEMKISECKTIDDIAIPKNVEEYKQVFRELVDLPKTKIYLYKNYMQHKDFDHFKTLAFTDDLARYKKWKDDSDVSVNKRFGLFEPTEELKERQIDKRILLKIYRERQNEKVVHDQKQIKERRILAVAEKLKKIRKENEELIKVEDKKNNSDDIVDDQNEDFRQEEEEEDAPDEEQAAKPPVGILPDVSTPRKKRTQIVREEIQELKSEPYFVPNFFKSYEGLEFIKLNPQRPPNNEVLMRMSQRMSRSIGGATEGEHHSSHGADQHEHISAAASQHREIEDNNPIVALEPEDEENRDQMRMSGMKHSQARSKMEGTLEEPQYVPSMYLQEKDYLKRRDEEGLLKAEEYHVLKTKEFNVTGKLRPLKIKVKSLAKSKIKPEINEKFVTTESITDKRIKISSMANRAYLNAPSVNQVRKQGQHQMILQGIFNYQSKSYSHYSYHQKTNFQ